MTKWALFYQEKLNSISYPQNFLNKYSDFIMVLLNSIDNNHYNEIVELGCGICNITRSLIDMRPQKHYTAIDNDIDMLKLSIKNIQSSRSFPEYLNIVYGDILFNEVTGDLAHSHGVLEHFNDVDIRQIIKNQLFNFKELIHYVPSAKYETPSFGDERLLTPKQWKDICNPDEILEFNDGYDLILKWRK